MIYYDNAATTFIKPKNVYKAVKKAIRVYAANPGRSGHRVANITTEAVYDARENVAEFFNAPGPENVVFTYNATYALNIVLKSMIYEKCHIVISDMEHNSVVRPLMKLADTYEVRYSVFDSSKHDLISEIESKVRKDTKFIVSTLRSNVTGRDIDYRALSFVKKKYGLSLIVDASQSAGHTFTDFKRIGCDALACPGHKGLFGITGCGIAIFKDGIIKNSVIEGGSGNESLNPYMPSKLPESYEAGTLGVAGILSVSAGIDYIKRIQVESIEEKLRILTEECIARLEQLPHIRIIEGVNGIVSIIGNGCTNAELTEQLNRRGICTRSGLHCAPLAHKTLGTLSSGTVRISFSYFNKIKELDKLYKCLKEMK